MFQLALEEESLGTEATLRVLFTTPFDSSVGALFAHKTRTHSQATFTMATTSHTHASIQRRYTFSSESRPIPRSMAHGVDCVAATPPSVGRIVTWPPPKRRASGSRLDEEYRWNWELTESSLQPLPMYQTLDRMSDTFMIPLETILTRVKNFMRLKSVACLFHPESGSIDCQTPALLRFAVFFWRGSQDTVILELQRRRGSAIEMQRLRKAIFQSVTSGVEPSSEALDRCTSVSPRSICPVIRQRYQAETETKRKEAQSQKKCCKESIDLCHDLLESHYEDQNRLGLESLLFLTDESITAKNTTQLVCKALLFAEGPCAECLRDELLCYFRLAEHAEERDDTWLNEINDRLEYVEGHNFMTMHNIALRVLANSLEEAVELEGLSSILEAVDWSDAFWETIFAALEYDMKEAIRWPQEAATSAKCLRLIEHLGPEALSHAMEDRLLPTLLQAYRFGEAHHFELQQEARGLLRCFSHEG